MKMKIEALEMKSQHNTALTRGTSACFKHFQGKRRCPALCAVGEGSKERTS